MRFLLKRNDKKKLVIDGAAFLITKPATAGEQAFTYYGFDYWYKVLTPEATDAELARAIEARTQLVRLLTGQGWPMPAIGVSGNGAHALYRVHIKAGPGWRDAAEVIYNTLRVRLADTCTEQ